jgi:hypothetical protein
MRVLVGGRVDIEREIVRLCARRHFDQARFDDLTRQLDKAFEGPRFGLWQGEICCDRSHLATDARHRRVASQRLRSCAFQT